MTSSAIAAADRAFAVLTARPTPLMFDARGMAGLPDRPLDLLELRDLLTARRVRGQALDAVWRRLAVQARQWGPAWTVAAVGMAAPRLSRMVAVLAASCPHLAEDIESEAVAGFLEALRTADLAAPNVWLRLMWSAWRSADRVRRTRQDVELPNDLSTGSQVPRAPYGHPDLLIGRAVALGVLTPDEGELIGDTRLGEVLLEQVAATRGVSAQVLRMRRNRAEHRLVAALTAGDLTDVLPATRHRRRRPSRPTPDERLAV